MNMIDHGQRIQLKMCGRKWRFRDRYDAAVQVATLKADGLARRADSLGSYRCPYCDGWHVGHQRPGKEAYT